MERKVVVELKEIWLRYYLLVDLKRKNYHQNCKKSGSELLTNMESMI